jgi:hypothetical protein
MEHIGYMGEKINVHEIFVRETEETTPFGRHRHNIICNGLVNVGETWRKNVE